jgi:Cu/Ag efflux pump CusA
MTENKEKNFEIIANIFAQKLPDNKATIGDITIDVVDHILSPFHQVETVLSGLFEGANIVNQENLADKKYVQKKMEGQDTSSTNQTELKKLAEEKTKLFPKYTKKFTITKTGGRGKKRKVAKKTSKRK